jgi:nicotinamidase-related amidase
VVLLVDLQERLMPAIYDGDVVVARAARVAQAAKLLGVPVGATEQYPAGLGPTVQPLAAYPGAVLAKTMFSALDDPDFPALLPVGSVEIVVAGCEAHVCVLQTVLGLLALGHRVVVVADADRLARPGRQGDRDRAGQAARRGDRHLGDGALRVAARLAPPAVREVQQLLK